jgi:SAM-dependent methyltransferase
MNEIRHAIKTQKKVYVFVANNVYIENETYIKNRESGNFKSAYTDDLKIHEFLADLRAKVTNHVILPFDTIDQIVETLKKQFAGLLQALLQKEASLTEGKTIYDLQETVSQIKKSIAEYDEKKAEFFLKFDSSIFSCNGVLFAIKRYLGLSQCSFFAKDVNALDEFMTLVGFTTESPIEVSFDCNRYYVKQEGKIKKSLKILDGAVNPDGTFKDNSIDLITAFETVFFWKKPEKAFSEIYRSLVKGGCFAVINNYGDPNVDWEKKVPCMTRYTAEQIANMLKSAGFADISHNKKENLFLVMGYKR